MKTARWHWVCKCYGPFEFSLSRDWSKLVTWLDNIKGHSFHQATLSENSSADKHPSIFSQQMEPIVYNNNNNNYSFWSASLRLGALTILNKNNEKKKIDDYLQDFYTVDQNYNTITMMKEKKECGYYLSKR